MSKLVKGPNGSCVETDLAHDAERLLETHARMMEEIQQVRQDRRLSDEYRQRVLSAKQAEHDQYLAGTQQEMLKEARKRFDKLQAQRKQVLNKNRAEFRRDHTKG